MHVGHRTHKTDGHYTYKNDAGASKGSFHNYRRLLLRGQYHAKKITTLMSPEYAMILIRYL